MLIFNFNFNYLKVQLAGLSHGNTVHFSQMRIHNILWQVYCFCIALFHKQT